MNSSKLISTRFLTVPLGLELSCSQSQEYAIFFKTLRNSKINLIEFDSQLGINNQIREKQNVLAKCQTLVFEPMIKANGKYSNNETKNVLLL